MWLNVARNAIIVLEYNTKKSIFTTHIIFYFISPKVDLHVCNFFGDGDFLFWKLIGGTLWGGNLWQFTGGLFWGPLWIRNDFWKSLDALVVSINAAVEPSLNLIDFNWLRIHTNWVFNRRFPSILQQNQNFETKITPKIVSLKKSLNTFCNLTLFNQN